MGKFSEFKLPLKSMPIGIHKFEYHLGQEFFTNKESSDIHDANLTVDLSVNHKSDIYDLTFNIKGEITLLCDRCLDEMQQPVDVEYHIVVKYGDEYCDESDEVLEIPENENYFNVADLIFDTVSLEIPIMHVHPDGECNEAMNEMLMKHQAGGDADIESDEESIDPRWAKLKELSENN
ncbi:MAG: DUF177 domain-containing protein [Muribaculaceae bacterium]|nr:DUF177 domain-containing protein [Muribaculaceae bacterium]